MAKVDPETCNTCLFFDTEHMNENADFTATHGKCRRYPPIVKHDVKMFKQPEVWRIDWCGEYSRDPR